MTSQEDSLVRLGRERGSVQILSRGGSSGLTRRNYGHSPVRRPFSVVLKW